MNQYQHQKNRVKTTKSLKKRELTQTPFFKEVSAKLTLKIAISNKKLLVCVLISYFSTNFNHKKMLSKPMHVDFSYFFLWCED